MPSIALQVRLAPSASGGPGASPVSDDASVVRRLDAPCPCGARDGVVGAVAAVIDSSIAEDPCEERTNAYRPSAGTEPDRVHPAEDIGRTREASRHQPGDLAGGEGWRRRPGAGAEPDRRHRGPRSSPRPCRQTARPGHLGGPPYPFGVLCELGDCGRTRRERSRRFPAPFAVTSNGRRSSTPLGGRSRSFRSSRSSGSNVGAAGGVALGDQQAAEDLPELFIVVGGASPASAPAPGGRHIDTAGGFGHWTSSLLAPTRPRRARHAGAPWARVSAFVAPASGRPSTVQTVTMGSPARSARSRAARWSTGRRASSRENADCRAAGADRSSGARALACRARCGPRSIGPSMAPPELSQGGEIGDAVEPGARLGLRGQAGKGPIRLEVCVLEHFIHAVAIAEQMEDELAKHRVVVLDHGGERPVIAGDGPSHHRRGRRRRGEQAGRSVDPRPVRQRRYLGPARGLAARAPAGGLPKARPIRSAAGARVRHCSTASSCRTRHREAAKASRGRTHHHSR